MSHSAAFYVLELAVVAQFSGSELRFIHKSRKNILEVDEYEVVGKLCNRLKNIEFWRELCPKSFIVRKHKNKLKTS